MSKSKPAIYAFIDSQNLNLAIKDQGWDLDFGRFFTYLKDKYKVSKAFIFIGYIDGNNPLYIALQSMSYICIFKPTLVYKDGTTKGNCDAELVLQTMIELNNFDKAVIVTGDGDFHCLVNHLASIEKLKRILIPNQQKYSALLKLLSIEKRAFVSDLKDKLEYKKKRPHKDETL